MDTRIALGVNPLVIPDQSASLQKALTLNALMGQSDLQGLQLQEGQRTLRKNQAIDEIGRTSTSTDDFIDKLSRVDAPAALKLRASLLDTQETQGKIDKYDREAAAANANAILSASKEDRPAVYARIHQQEIAKGNKAAAAFPAEWNDALLPHIVALQEQAQAPKDAIERRDYQATRQPSISTTVAALSGQPTAPVPSPAAPVPATTLDALGQKAPNLPREYTPSGVVVPQAQSLAQTAPQPQEQVMPQVDVTAKTAPYSPEDYRAEAARLRRLATPGADKRAKDYEEEANRLDQRGLEEQKLTEMTRQRDEQIALRKQNLGNQNVTNTGKFGDDFRQEQAVKDYRTVQPLVAAMHNAAGKNNAASDLDMVYAIAKIFDPGSVVREGEQVMIVNAGGLPSKIQSIIGNVNGGQRLSSTLRQELLEQAESRVDNYKQAYDSVSKSYRATAERFGLNPDDIIRDYQVTPKGASAGVVPPAPEAGKIPAPSDRIPGNTYSTPKGKLKWTGTGWVQP